MTEKLELHSLLTKTDFTLARSCPTKLYYFKKNYPSPLDSSDYVEFLKEGGHIIGEMARLIHPEGIYIGVEQGVEAGLEQTSEALKQDNITLLEAAFHHQGMLVVCDILEKKGSFVNVIEVKSKSFDADDDYQIIGKRGGIVSEWVPYIEDITFQKHVVSKCLPNSSVSPYILVPDKTKTANIDSLASLFQIERFQTESGEFLRVNFEGDRAELLKHHFLTRVNVEDACRLVEEDVAIAADQFTKSLQPKLVKISTPISKHCKECEFKHDDTTQSGYQECWKELADVTPHVFDLYYGGALKLEKRFVLDDLIADRKVSLFDIPSEAIKGKRGERQSIQIEYTKKNDEWVNPSFESALKNYSYPLHFIDFETSTSAIPYHKGMRPYEQIAFQWSSHTIDEPGATPRHSDWINLEEAFPSFEFAESLMEEVSHEGTVFMWADHENRVLKEIARQMTDYGHVNSALSEWIETMTVSKDSEGRLVDMKKLCLHNYFHPAMKGSNSIKYVLPAIWNNNSYLWDIPFLVPFFLKDEEGNVLSPYEALPDIEIDGVKQIVKEGTGAMTAYQEMMYGFSRDNAEVKQNWSKLLRQYCELDTLAMVIIWIHWRHAFGLSH